MNFSHIQILTAPFWVELWRIKMIQLFTNKIKNINKNEKFDREKYKYLNIQRTENTE